MGIISPETDLLINNEHFFVDRIAEALFWEPGVDGKFTEQFSGHYAWLRADTATLQRTPTVK